MSDINDPALALSDLVKGSAGLSSPEIKQTLFISLVSNICFISMIALLTFFGILSPFVLLPTAPKRFSQSMRR